MKIRTKLTILFSGVTGLLLLVSASTGYYLVKKQLTAGIERELSAQVARHAEALNSSLLSKQKMLEISWHNLQNTTRGGPLTASMLSGYKTVDPELTAMYFGSAAGELVDGSGWIPPTGYDPRVRPWYTTAVEKGQLTVTDPYLEFSQQQLAVGIVMPVVDEAGRFQGVVGADIPIAALVDKIIGIRLYEGGYAYLIDAKGMMLAHPEPALVAQNALALPELAELKAVFVQMQEQETGFLRYHYKGIERLVVFQRVPAVNWVMALTVPAQEVYQPLVSAANLFVFLTLLGLSLVVWVAAKVAGRITGPVEALARQTALAGEGNLEVKAQAVGSDELAALARGFNTMVANLRALIEQMNQEAERTAAQLEAFQEVTGRLITDAESSEELFSVITQDVIRMVGSSHSLIATLEADRRHWVVRRVAGPTDVAFADRGLVDEGLLGETLRRGEVVFVPDYHAYANALPVQRARSTGSCIGLPLYVGGQAVGVLLTAWSQRIVAVDAKIGYILRQYANIAAAAIERMQNNEELRRLALTDVLTGLPNRRYFYQLLHGALAPGGTGPAVGAVLLIDLDNLKLINDSFGHSYGDEYICIIAEKLAEAVCGHGVVARIGGDEFCVWLPERSGEAVFALADALLATLERWEKIGDQQLHVTASLGLALYPKDGRTAEELLQNADLALYDAKNAGKNTWRAYADVLQAATRERLLLSNSLRHAVERAEMSLVYQPVVTPAGRITGFEALLRWNSPEHGAVSPAKFIPLAEQGYLMKGLGKWVLQEASRFAQALRGLGRTDLQVHVNLSAQQLEEASFVALVTEIVADAGIQAGQIGLELTESVLMESLDEAVDKLRALQAQGFLVELDDFGEGFSSLAQLLRLPVGRLKISRTLIKGLGDEPRHLQYISALVDMMHALEINVVAEGVETQSEWQAVAACRFDYVQGFYFSRPLPPVQALALLATPEEKAD